jgi:tetratricopeptide (TPR) repeat protein
LYLALSALAAKEKRFDEATTALTDGAQRFPSDVLFTFQRGALLEQQRRYDEAEQAFREVLKVDPLHGPTLNYLGYMLAERGVRLDEAVSLTQRAVDTDPWNGSYLDSLAWAYFKRGDFDAARKYLSMAVDRLPLNSVVQDHWGDLLWKEGDRNGAVGAWQRALDGDRESIDPAAITRKIEDAGRKNP